MNLYTVPFYKNAPFLRIVLPFAAGIFFQDYLQVSLKVLTATVASTLLFLVGFSLLKLTKQFSYQRTRGVVLHLLLIAAGGLALYMHDDRNDRYALVQKYQPGEQLVLTISEPLIEKPASYKALASVNGLVNQSSVSPVNGGVLLYFKKTPASQKLKYGDVIITGAVLQPVSNTGNPEAFDYRLYCARQNIFHQLYLTDSSYILTDKTSVNRFRQFIFGLRRLVVGILQQYIPGSKESGLAQAILIGYKDNLDKELVQSYSNTGVVHVIAISGLHLGLIYAILLLLTRSVGERKYGKLPQLLMILAGLWIFAILAGASASVVRSAVMFTCIATGKALSRNLSVYNSLAASAFLLLTYNPYWLWDTGFQLSYAAVLSIVIYQKPVVNLILPDNKLLVMLWKTCAITLSAQILTTPVSLYYFHQFPNLFLITNLVAIPLSSLILIAGIILCCLFFVAPVALFIGKITGYLIIVMNRFVEYIDAIPFANWHALQISNFQFLLLFAVIAGITIWRLEHRKAGVGIAFIGLIVFVGLRTYSFWLRANQQKLIVYNIPRSSAVELLSGRHAYFAADSQVVSNEATMRFNVTPSRIFHRVKMVVVPAAAHSQTTAFMVARYRILIVKQPVVLRLPPDIGILSGQVRGNIQGIFKGHLPKFIVTDSSVPRYRARKWKEECALLGIPCHVVTEDGAFVMTLN